MSSGRGFASMNKARLREVSSKGGKASQASGGHRWNALEAKWAGIKGGATTAKDRGHMAEAGRKGGLAKARRAS